MNPAIRKLALQSMKAMESRGLRVDVMSLRAEINKLSVIEQERVDLTAEIGIDPWKRKLFGLKSSSAETLRRLGTPEALKVVDFRHRDRVYKMLCSFYQLAETGVLKWEWKIAKTNRLYASGAVLTLAKECRQFVVPWNSECFYLWDYKQQELRLIALATGNKKLLSMLEDGVDIHSVTGEIAKSTRTVGKTIDYAKMFGMDIEALKSSFKLSDCQVNQIESYLPTQKLAQIAASHVVSGTKTLINIFGTAIQFLEEKDLAPYYIQSSGADILWNILGALKRIGIQPDICIHDAIMAEENNPVIAKTMEFTYSGVNFPVVLKTGKTWAEVTD